MSTCCLRWVYLPFGGPRDGNPLVERGVSLPIFSLCAVSAIAKAVLAVCRLSSASARSWTLKPIVALNTDVLAGALAPTPAIR